MNRITDKQIERNRMIFDEALRRRGDMRVGKDSLYDIEDETGCLCAKGVFALIVRGGVGGADGVYISREEGDINLGRELYPLLGMTAPQWHEMEYFYEGGFPFDQRHTHAETADWLQAQYPVWDKENKDND